MCTWCESQIFSSEVPLNIMICFTPSRVCCAYHTGNVGNLHGGYLKKNQKLHCTLSLRKPGRGQTLQVLAYERAFDPSTTIMVTLTQLSKKKCRIHGWAGRPLAIPRSALSITLNATSWGRCCYSCSPKPKHTWMRDRKSATVEVSVGLPLESKIRNSKT